MGDIGDFLRGIFRFLVSTPRRRFANKIGRCAGMITLLLSTVIATCIFTSEFGGLSCLPAFMPLLPIFFILDFIGIDGPESLNFVFYTVGTSLFYYLVAYFLGMIFFRENKSTKTKTKKN